VARRIDGKDFVVGDSIADILAEAGISTRGVTLRAGSDVKAMCPACGGGRSKERSLSIKMDTDGAGVAWHCFRGQCTAGGGWPAKGNGRIENSDRGGDHQPTQRVRPNPVKPQLDPESDQHRPEGMYQWFLARGISADTVDAFGIYAAPKFRWAGAGGVWVEKPTIVYPYAFRGEVVNRKFRSIDKDFRQDMGAARTIYNIDAWTSPDVAILVEGENDVLALWEAGYRQVGSLPDGAPQSLLDEDDDKRLTDKRFDAMETCADELAAVQKIIIATDADVPGGYLAEEFARRLGRTRCWRVTWPAGCKDAGEVLQKHGPGAVRDAIEAAHPWPLAGLWEPEQGSLVEFLHSGQQVQGLDCGIKAVDAIARMPRGGGWLTVVTGIPSHGKSRFLKAWMVGLLSQNPDLGIVWCSPEDNQPQVLALELVSILAGQPTREAGTFMPRDMIQKAERWISERITFVWNNNPDVEMTLEWILARAEEAKTRRRRNLLWIDPFNEVEFTFSKGESETQFIGRWLRRLKAWGRAEGFGVGIVVHPKNQVPLNPKTKEYPVVDGYDINGGANWNNKADLGLTVYRRREGAMELHTWKARFPAFGQRKGTGHLQLDHRTGRLSSISTDQQESMEMEDRGEG
jgi:twinkle protein